LTSFGIRGPEVRNVERTKTEIDSALFEAVHRLAGEQGCEDSEVI
jgi:hypothetical protein